MSEPAEHPDGVPREGDLLGGKYRVERVIGVGGMGAVLAARHIDIGHVVAIKVMMPAVMKNPDAVARFLREAQAAGRLRSEHVVRIHDVGKMANGAPFLVMDLLEGIDLAGLVQARGPLPFEQTVEFVLQACDALADAHAAGIVHRDVKPSNLFVTQRADGTGQIRVLDFGISKHEYNAADESLTRSDVTMGSPMYMSPEQIRNARNVDRRSDIWSIGVVLYELIAGTSPFESESFSSLCVAIAIEPHVPLSARRADVPGELEAVVNRCLEKEPARRFQSVTELARALAPFAPMRARALAEKLATSRVSLAPATNLQFAATARIDGTTVTAPSAWDTNGPHANAHARARMAVLAGLAVGALTVLAFTTLQLRAPPSPAPAASGQLSIPVVAPVPPPAASIVDELDDVPPSVAPTPSAAPSATTHARTRRAPASSAQATAPSSPHAAPPTIAPSPPEPSGSPLDDRK